MLSVGDEDLLMCAQIMCQSLDVLTSNAFVEMLYAVIVVAGC